MVIGGGVYHIGGGVTAPHAASANQRRPGRSVQMEGVGLLAAGSIFLPRYSI